MNRNSELGMTIQKIICELYNLSPCERAEKQFEAAFNNNYRDQFETIIPEIFKKIGSAPKCCLTFTQSADAGRTLCPHNFLLESGETLSIRTNLTGDKIAPRTVGQAGFEKLNYFFCDIVGKNICSQQDIKEAIISKIDKMLPVFVDSFFVSDYTVWLQLEDGCCTYTIIDSKKFVDINYDYKHFSFTRGLKDWNESTTLKYRNRSLAEIQVHRNRTFKFRFAMGALISLLKEESQTTESLGITAEKVVCEIFDLEIPTEYNGRASESLSKQIYPVVQKAFEFLPRAVCCTGALPGARGKNSKCSYDFQLTGNKTLSLKTNTGKMVCPPEVGQPGAETCLRYFKRYTNVDIMTSDAFKEMVFEHIADMIPIYLHHLFDSDYLLWIYWKNDTFCYKIFDRAFGAEFSWDPQKFSFTKQTQAEWNESNTVKYNNLSIGEFQVHKNRACYKFRFNLENLEKLMRS